MEIDKLIANYKPDQIVIDVLNKCRIVFLAGIMSAGKDALQNELLKLPEYQAIVTHTTRLPRINNGLLEKDNVDYHFISQDQMEKLLIDKKMIEVNHFGNNFYGTNIEEFSNANTNDKIAICDIDIHGIAAMHDIAPNNVTAIFVVPPDYETWIQRIRKRYGSLDAFNIEWQNRREITINEIEYALNAEYYHFVINDDLNATVSEINEIVNHHGFYNENDNRARLCAKKLLDEIRLAL